MFSEETDVVGQRSWISRSKGGDCTISGEAIGPFSRTVAVCVPEPPPSSVSWIRPFRDQSGV